MGQRHSEPTDANSPVEVTTDSRYANLDTAELARMVQARSLTLPKRASGLCSPDRAVLITLLMAFDAGMSAGSGSTFAHQDHEDSSQSSRICPSALRVLRRIRDAPGHMGVDIGGTLVKMAIALPAAVAADYQLPEKFGSSGRTHHDLQFELRSGELFVVRFVSGSTAQMEEAVQHLGLRRNKSWSHRERVQSELISPRLRRTPSSSPKFQSIYDGDELDGGTGGSYQAQPFEDAVHTEVEFSRTFSSWSDAGSWTFRPMRRIAAAGGGACKFAPLFRDALHVEINPVKELSAVVSGLLLLAAQHAEVDGQDQDRFPMISCKFRREADLFTVDEDGRSLQLPWPKPLFPLLLVNMGSGVSILRVDSARDNDYVRVGGTACGGATFLGLSRALTSAQSFEEALALAEHGDASRADKLVRDIYGEEGSASLGLAGNLTAANFGKLCEMPIGGVSGQMCSEQDLARSLLQMVTQQSVLLATAFAKHADCLDRVFFVGGFVDEPNKIARAAIASNFRSLGGCAYFLRHSDFLGALGSLRVAFQQLEKH